MPAEAVQQEDTFSKSLSKSARFRRAISISSRYKDSSRHGAITEANTISRGERFYQDDMNAKNMKDLGRMEKARDRASFLLKQANHLASLVAKESVQKNYMEEIREKTQDRHMLSAVMAAREAVNGNTGEDMAELERKAQFAAVQALNRSFHGTENRKIMEDASSTQEQSRQSALQELQAYLAEKYSDLKNKLFKSAAIQGSEARMQIPKKAADTAAGDGAATLGEAQVGDGGGVAEADEGVNYVDAPASRPIDTDTNAAIKKVSSIVGPATSGVTKGIGMAGDLFSDTDTSVSMSSFADNADSIAGWQSGVGGALGTVGLAGGVLGAVVNGNNLDRHIGNGDGASMIMEDSLGMVKSLSSVASSASAMAGTFSPGLASTLVTGTPALGALGGAANMAKGINQLAGGALRKKAIKEQGQVYDALREKTGDGAEKGSVDELAYLMGQAKHAAHSDIIEGSIATGLGAAQAASGFIPGVGSAVSLATSLGATVNEKAVDRKRKLNIRDYMDKLVPWKNIMGEIRRGDENGDTGATITEGMQHLSDRDIKHTVLNFAGAQSGKRLEGGLLGLRSAAHALRDKTDTKFEGKEIMMNALRIKEGSSMEKINRRLGMTKRHAANADVAINRRIEDAKLANEGGASGLSLKRGRLSRFFGNVYKNISSK